MNRNPILRRLLLHVTAAQQQQAGKGDDQRHNQHQEEAARARAAQHKPADIPINQDADASSPWVNVATTGDASGTATFNLKARYKSFLDKVTAGTANASATFTIEYK